MKMTIYYWLLTIVLFAFLLLPFYFAGKARAETAIINSFNRGEITPELLARQDLRSVYSAVRLMENFYVQTHGGASKRPGTYYIAESADSEVVGRLIGFGHSTGTNNVLEFGDKTIRFYKGN